ncbi:MAG: phosphohydrolase [Candidatus Delongbacteria bacterium]|nr:phosphohydrolase [Candidatus Delongbacteria bacterium]MCG2761426.1 phosphohydrolase [Candidatus Delongbacteria bacterium]
MKSKKQNALDRSLIGHLEGKVLRLAEILINNEEVEILQEYANTVSITRLNYNDHGPVHMRKVASNAMKIMNIMDKAGIKFNLELENIGDIEDSRIAVFIASFLHDIGMSIGRDGHEKMTITLTDKIIENVLIDMYPGNIKMQLIIKSLVYEGIIGHMGTQRIHSLEAGVVLVADGCDMEGGRARIPLIIESGSKVGDIHKYSSAAIQKVYITDGSENPVRIQVEMKESVGFFQVEEVLMKKINLSPVKKYIELYAGIIGQDLKRYL